jgi:hypothetical protein
VATVVAQVKEISSGDKRFPSTSDTLAAEDGGDVGLLSGSIARAAGGTGSLWEDANVTSITIGGGAAQTTVTIGKSSTTTALLGALTVAETSTFTGVADFDAGITVAAGQAVTGDGALSLTATGASIDLTLGARSSTITLNESGEESLNADFSATSIVGGLNELMAEGREVLLSTTSSIDATATGTTNLFTVPASKTIVVTKAIIRLTAVATFTSAPTLGIGVAAGEDDIFSPQLMTGVDAITEGYVFAAGAGNTTLAAAAEVIKLGIDTAAVAGTYTIAVDLFGFEVGGGSGGGSGAAVNPYAEIRRTTHQLIANSTWTTVAWDEEAYDTGGFADLGTDNDRFTLSEDGSYDCRFEAVWTANTTSDRLHRILRYNSSDVLQDHVMCAYRTGANAGVFPRMVATKIFHECSGGDYFIAQVQQRSGGNLNLDEWTGTAGTWFGIMKAT